MAQVSLPVSFEAFEHFQRQGDLFCVLDYTGSLEEGRRAVALSPEYIPALGLMGVTFNNLGRVYCPNTFNTLMVYNPETDSEEYGVILALLKQQQEKDPGRWHRLVARVKGVSENTGPGSEKCGL